MSHVADSDRPPRLGSAALDAGDSSDVEEDQEARPGSSSPEEVGEGRSWMEMEDGAMAARQPGHTEASTAACLQQGGLWLQGLGASYWGGAPPRGHSEHRTSLSQYLRARELKGSRPPSHRFLRTTSRRLPHILKVPAQLLAMLLHTAPKHDCDLAQTALTRCALRLWRRSVSSRDWIIATRSLRLRG